jgi:2'-5' RNA ligase
VTRLFVAVRPSEAVAGALDRIERPDLPGVRWVPPENWHVTLRFLGRANESNSVRALQGLVAPTAQAVIGGRPGRLGADALVLPVHGLEPLAAQVRAQFEGIGSGQDRAFVGHLTLARLRHRAACGVLAPFPPLRWRADTVELLASEAGAGTYRTVAVVALGLS